ncbi:hypothetical protein [Sagittula sp. S175]|uniref:hypothetical protein n=1 Tax=Sagittula sp. S175 TaxID=3415129 RepID=UPI003C7CB27F
MLRSERLVLRPLTGADADWIHTQITRPEVHRRLAGVPFPCGRATQGAPITSGCVEADAASENVLRKRGSTVTGRVTRQAPLPGRDDTALRSRLDPETPIPQAPAQPAA